MIGAIAERVAWIVGSPAALAFAVIAGGLVAGRLAAALLRPLLARLAARSATRWDDAVVRAATTPLSILLALQAVRAFVPELADDPRASRVVVTGIGLGTSVMVMWAAFRLVDVIHALLETRSWAVDRPAARSLLSIGGRLAKVMVVIFTGITVLAQLGVAVASLVAGLGIGGLAIALAGQKTVEHLFGTLSIGLDQPLREGDFVKIDDFVGTVEAIGLRSTRVRTVDRTLVTIPNGQLAEMRIESFAVRDRIRLACTLGLVYETTSDQLRQTLSDLEGALRTHPKIWPDAVVVRFSGFGESSLDVDVMAWFQTADWSEFQRIRQDVFIEFMEIVERNGSSFAFPTRTLMVSGDEHAAAITRARTPATSSTGSSG